MSAIPANALQSIPARAFTIEYDGLTRQLLSEASVIFSGKEIPTRALWDTGASRTCISTEAAELLKLPSTGKMMIQTPSGTDSVDTFLIDLALPNQVKIEGVPVCGTRIGEQGIGALIGMDIIALGDLAISNFSGKTCFSFRMPSLTKLDFVREINPLNTTDPKHG